MAEVDLKTKLKTFPKIKSVKRNEDGTLTLKWTKVDYAEKYDIKRSESYDGEYVHIDWAKKPEYTDTDVKENVTYWYKVVAWKRLEGKKTSTKESAFKPGIVSFIRAPGKLRAKAEGDEIKLSWTVGESGGDSFAVYKRSELFSRLMPLGVTDKTSFTDKNAVAGQAYHYRVQTLIKGEGGFVHGRISKEFDCVNLAKCKILSAKAFAGKNVAVETRIVSGADGYILLRSDSENGEFTEVARTKDITAIELKDKVPSHFKTYYYKVKAYKIIAEKEFTGDASDVKAVKSK